MSRGSTTRYGAFRIDQKRCDTNSRARRSILFNCILQPDNTSRQSGCSQQAQRCVTNAFILIQKGRIGWLWQSERASLSTELKLRPPGRRQGRGSAFADSIGNGAPANRLNGLEVTYRVCDPQSGWCTAIVCTDHINKGQQHSAS